MKKLLILALVGAMAFTTFAWLQARAFLRQAVAVIGQQSLLCKQENQRVAAENIGLQAEVQRLHTLYVTSFYNNEEILAAAKAGQIERAHALREIAVKKAKKSA